ncbi:MAG TPA: EamA family transporter [Candidatus Limnocylindrales bacterium]|nr:EamA family transporter [Candidatus Limnocylindrales bacterium]
MTVIFGLAAAVAWGAGDFGGGLASRRVPVYGVVLVSQAAGGALCLVLALVLGESFPTGKDLLVCIAAGLVGGLGITMLYRGLAIGRMGIVAPITGVLAAVIPVIAGFVIQGVPPPLVIVGIVLAIVAVVLVSRVADETGGRDGLTEALVGGTAIGLFGVAIAQLSPGDLFADLTTIRLVQGLLVVLIVIATRAAWRPGRLVLPLILIGLLDTVGNALYLAAVQTGQLAIASVLSAMYPVATVILAAAVLREPITRDHTVGIALAAAAIALISLGGG